MEFGLASGRRNVLWKNSLNQEELSLIRKTGVAFNNYYFNPPVSRQTTAEPQLAVNVVPSAPGFPRFLIGFEDSREPACV
jgi:hypothetical protein